MIILHTHTHTHTHTRKICKNCKLKERETVKICKKCKPVLV